MISLSSTNIFLANYYENNVLGNYKVKLTKIVRARRRLISLELGYQVFNTNFIFSIHFGIFSIQNETAFLAR